MDNHTLATLTRLAECSRERWGLGTPFEIVTRLTEETGEIAGAINHLENKGVKHLKHSHPQNETLSKEICDTFRCLLDLIHYYNLEEAVSNSAEATLKGWETDGFLVDTNKAEQGAAANP